MSWYPPPPLTTASPPSPRASSPSLPGPPRDRPRVCPVPRTALWSLSSTHWLSGLPPRPYREAQAAVGGAVVWGAAVCLNSSEDMLAVACAASVVRCDVHVVMYISHTKSWRTVTEKLHLIRK